VDAVKNRPELVAQLNSLNGALRYLQEEAHVEYPEGVLYAILTELLG